MDLDVFPSLVETQDSHLHHGHLTIKSKALPNNSTAERLAAPLGVEQCAVLGNAGSLLGARAGAFLTTMDEVYRINLRPFAAMPSVSQPGKVGVDVTWAAHFEQAIADRPDNVILVHPTQLNVANFVDLTKKLKKSGAPSRALLSHQYLMHVSHAVLCSKAPGGASSGLLTVLYAMMRCKTVHVFGIGDFGFGLFDGAQACAWPHWWFGLTRFEHEIIDSEVTLLERGEATHFLDDPCALTRALHETRARSMHNFTAEQELLRVWHDEKRILWHQERAQHPNVPKCSNTEIESGGTCVGPVKVDDLFVRRAAQSDESRAVSIIYGSLRLSDKANMTIHVSAQENLVLSVLHAFILDGSAHIDFVGDGMPQTLSIHAGWADTKTKKLTGSFNGNHNELLKVSINHDKEAGSTFELYKIIFEI